MKHQEGLHIAHERVQQHCQPSELSEQPADPTSDWLSKPELWDKQTFFVYASKYLSLKNGGIDISDKHLLNMLASQIEIYVESILKLRTDGLVMTFNGGVTVGPNPCMAITDKSLHRIIQLMKELELSPKSRDGYLSERRTSPELLKFLNGP